MKNKCIVKVLLGDFVEFLQSLGIFVVVLTLICSAIYISSMILGFGGYQIEGVQMNLLKGVSGGIYEHMFRLGILGLMFFGALFLVVIMIKDIVIGIIDYIVNGKYRCRK